MQASQPLAASPRHVETVVVVSGVTVVVSSLPDEMWRHPRRRPARKTFMMPPDLARDATDTSVPPAEVTADREAASCWPSYLPSPGPALPAQLVPRRGLGWHWQLS